MKILHLGIAILALPFGAFGAGMGAPLGPDNQDVDPLAGKWLVISGDVKEDGYFFDPLASRSCGAVEFRQLVRGQMANFEPDGQADDHTAPWGRYDAYRFDEHGVLTLKNYSGADVRCFLKFKAVHPREASSAQPSTRPYVCVFYEPERRRAFKIFRREEIGALAVPNQNTGGGPVFVPFEDPLTGSWILPPGQSLEGGQVRFFLDQTTGTGTTQIVVNVDNSIDLRSGSRAAHFRLRQYASAHWSIEPASAMPGTKGILTLEREAGRVIGSNVLLTRWQVGPKTMTAVLLAEGSRQPPNVPVVQFEKTSLLDFDLLASLAEPPAAPPTNPVP